MKTTEKVLLSVVSLKEWMSYFSPIRSKVETVVLTEERNNSMTKISSNQKPNTKRKKISWLRAL